MTAASSDYRMETMKARGGTGTRSPRARRVWAIDPLIGMMPKQRQATPSKTRTESAINDVLRFPMIAIDAARCAKRARR
jgi:hypothetical protein